MILSIPFSSIDYKWWKNKFFGGKSLGGRESHYAADGKAGAKNVSI